MSAAPLKALVVGDRFMRAELFADALRREADAARLDLEVERLELHFPAIDDVPLPERAPSAPFRPLWEDPAVALARHDQDDAADPTIHEYTGPVDLLVPHLAGVHALVVHAAPVSRAAVAAATDLRAIGCARGGPVNLNMDAIDARGIPIFNSPGRNAEAVAEFLMGAILSLTRGIAAGARAMAERRWQLDLYTYERVGAEVRGRTLGLVGFGGVGKAFAPIARGFGLRLLVHDPYVDDSTLHAAGAERADLDTLLSNADFVVMAARLTSETRGMIGARQLALLRPEAIFVNTARAELVDQAALRDALLRRAFAGAALDVYSPEPPLRDDPLLGRADVLLTPHIAGATREAASNGADVVAARVAVYLSSGSLEGCANRQAVEAALASAPTASSPSPSGRGSG